LEEDELSYAEESAARSEDGMDTLIDRQRKVGGVDDTVPLNAAGIGSELKFTEEDIDEDNIPDDQKETQRLAREIQDLSDADSAVSFSESFEDPVVMPSSSSGNHLLLAILIIITAAIMGGTLYYYMYWLPQQQAGIQTTATSAGGEAQQAPDAQADITDQSVVPSEDGQLTAEPAAADVPASSPEDQSTLPKASETPAESNVDAGTDKTQATPVDQPESVPVSKTEKASEPAKTAAEPVPSEPKQTRTVKPDASADVPVTPRPATRPEIDPKYATNVSSAKTAFSTMPGGYTIQLEIACEQETLDLAIKLLEPLGQAYFVPFMISGRTCYVVCYGLYSTESSAQQAMADLPEVFFEENEPYVSTTASLLRRF